MGNGGERAFPRYSQAERIADAAVHAVGLAAGVGCTIWLVDAVCSGATTPRQVVALAAYCAGLLGMLGASAAYNLARPGSVKAVLRRLDHAMIFVMIAGSYTPFALQGLGTGLGVGLCALIWTVAVAGVVVKMAWYRRTERLSLVLYLGMGWVALPLVGPLGRALPEGGLALLLGGGVAYTAGSVIHARERMKFHNPVWHAMVLVGAGLHFAAISRLLAR